MRRGRCESRSDDHGREALALLDSLKGKFTGQAAPGGMATPAIDLAARI